MSQRDLPAPSASIDQPVRPRTRKSVQWVAVGWAGLLLLSLFIAAPLALGSIVKQLVLPPALQSHVLSPGGGSLASSNSLRVTVTALDEAKKTAALRLSGYRAC